MDIILSKRLDRIEQLINKLNVNVKEILTVDEAISYSGISKRHLYELRSNGAIPYFKPGGKLTFMRRADIDAYLLSKQVVTEKDVKEAAKNFVLK